MFGSTVLSVFTYLYSLPSEWLVAGCELWIALATLSLLASLNCSCLINSGAMVSIGPSQQGCPEFKSSLYVQICMFSSYQCGYSSFLSQSNNMHGVISIGDSNFIKHDWLSVSVLAL